MPFFRNKPVVREAVLWTGENWREILDWMKWRNASHDDHEGLRIHTLEGTQRANPGDWIIKGVAGEFYPCKPEIFAATYEAVEGAARLIDGQARMRELEKALQSIRSEVGTSTLAWKIADQALNASPPANKEGDTP